MNRNRQTLLFALGAILLHAELATAQAKNYDISQGTYTGEMLIGPKTVRAFNLNTIRYNYQFGTTVTFQKAPDLWTNLQTVATQSATTPVTTASLVYDLMRPLHIFPKTVWR